MNGNSSQEIVKTFVNTSLRHPRGYHYDLYAESKEADTRYRYEMDVPVIDCIRLSRYDTVQHYHPCRA